MNEILFLEHKAYQLRVDCLQATTAAGSGHVTSCLSAADIVAALFFHVMQFDPDAYDNPCNDRFILSKGHAAPLLYAAWKELGKISEKELVTLRQFNSRLEGHPTPRFSYSEAATGSLGQGLSVGVGMACAAHADKHDYHTFVLLGDSEMTEGSNWEAAELASYYRLNNLIAIIDVNRLGQSTQTIEGYHLERYKKKFEAFGWRAVTVDGHNMAELVKVLASAREETEKPIIIIAKTIKGYGLDAEIEGQEGFHGKALPSDRLNEFLELLRQKFPEAAQYNQQEKEYKNNIPSYCEDDAKKTETKFQKSNYQLGDMIATRKAYGQALVHLGACDSTVVSLDAEVKNSTYAELFEKAYPDRFYQCFIAEQNMVGMGVGMQGRGKTPFISTFAAFFSRAYDQVRMASVGRVPLRLIGSHAGVSIGQDGPSQMGLEDIAMMRALPESIVLYPCDAVSTHACVGIMHGYDKGISYLRTTRMQTLVIYAQDENFTIGGCKIIKQTTQDKLCIIAAGVTLFEALKAYEELQKQGINVTVIDCYSIKPLPIDELVQAIKAAGNRFITVEDHYVQGGLGEAVCSTLCNQSFESIKLAVNKLPRSGKPEELLVFEGIDTQAIITAVQKLL
jgi:transketolase